ncbi:FAD-dependent oxidoreductase [bacterium]|nr:FAD-dependent oxidoreductase [bacterium]
MAGADLIVVGGGIAGLAVAWEARCRGLETVLLERDAIGGGASQASAGILGPAGRTGEDHALTALCWRGIRAFPAWTSALSEAAPGDPGFALKGVLYPPEPAAEERAAALRREGEPYEWLDGAILAARFPWLAVERALLAKSEGHVHPRRLLFLLRDAVAARGGRVVEGAETTTLVPTNGGWEVGATDGRSWQATKVVVATGSWQGPKALGWAPPVRPVKGQLVEVRGDPAQMPTLCLHGSAAYLAVQGPGVGWIGTTLQEAGFAQGVDRATLLERVAQITEWAPGVGKASLGESWWGFRPGTPDDRPILGERPGLPGLFFAMGLYRNGIQLAPEVARLAGLWLAGEDATPPEFLPGRFP